MMTFGGPSRNAVDHGNDRQSQQDMSVPVHSNQQQPPQQKFCLAGSFAVSRLLAMESAKQKAACSPSGTMTAAVKKPMAAPPKSAEKSAAQVQEKVSTFFVPATTTTAKTTPNNADNAAVVKPLKTLKIMDQIRGGKPKKTTRIQISMKQAGNSSKNSNNNKGATTTQAGSKPPKPTSIPPVVPLAVSTATKSVSSLSSLGSNTTLSTTASTVTRAAPPAPRRVSVVSASSDPSVSSTNRSSSTGTSSSTEKNRANKTTSLSTHKKSTTTTTSSSSSSSSSPMPKTDRPKVEKKKNTSISSAGSVSSASTSSSKIKKELVPSPYDLTFCAEDDFALFQTVDKKIREANSPIRLLVEAIAGSSLLYSETWQIHGKVHQSKFDPSILDNESIVLGLNKKLFAKPDMAVLHRLCKDLFLNDMAKYVVEDLGFERDYPKIAKEGSRLLAARKMLNVKCILFLARFHCASMYWKRTIGKKFEMDPNLLYVVQKCLSIVEGYAVVTPKKKRGRKKSDDMAAVAVDDTVATTETGHARRVSVLEEDKESLHVFSTRGDAAVAPVYSPNDVNDDEAKKKTKRRLPAESLETSALPLKKRRVAVSVDSFPALEDLVVANAVNDPEEQMHLAELEMYFKQGLLIIQRRQQALDSYNCS